MSRRLLPFLAALATSCGGGGSSVPTRPLTPVPTPTPLSAPTLVDGITGQPVEGALLNPPGPGRNERMMITAPSYLTREQLYTGEPVRLWPAKDEDYVRQLVYTQATTKAEIRMRRFAGSSFTLGLPPDIADFPWPATPSSTRPTRQAGCRASRSRWGMLGPCGWSSIPTPSLIARTSAP